MSHQHDLAQQYWQQRLANQQLISRPQHPACNFSIVVAVQNERLDRLIRQIDSLQRQHDLPTEEYELLYVINNAPADVTEKSIIDINQQAISYITRLNLPNVFAIDCSSPEHAIVDCNLGRARNRGVAEASWRFDQAGKNGWLILTDADCYFDDTHYFSKFKAFLTEPSDVIGIAGGLVFEFSPDTDQPLTVAAMRDKLSLLELLQRWQYLEHWLRQINAGLGYELPLHFSGAHMISRSLESACVGGLPDLAGGSDEVFGQTLIQYAHQHGKQIIDGRDRWEVVTAVRESFRTTSSFGKLFNHLDPTQPPPGTDLGLLIATISDQIPREMQTIPMTWHDYHRFAALVEKLPNGSAMNRRLDDMARRLTVAKKQSLWNQMIKWIKFGRYT